MIQTVYIEESFRPGLVLQKMIALARAMVEGAQSERQTMQRNDKILKVTKLTSEVISGQLVLYICLPMIRRAFLLRLADAYRVIRNHLGLVGGKPRGGDKIASSPKMCSDEHFG